MHHWSWIWVTANRYILSSQSNPPIDPPYTIQNGTSTDPPPPWNWSQWIPPNEPLNKPEWTSFQITPNSPTNGPSKIHPTKTPTNPLLLKTTLSDWFQITMLVLYFTLFRFDEDQGVVSFQLRLAAIEPKLNDPADTINQLFKATLFDV